MIARFVLLLVLLLYSGWGMNSARSIAAADKTLQELERSEEKSSGDGKSASVFKDLKKAHSLMENYAGVYYNRANFDIYPTYLAPLLGYISYSKEYSFNSEEFLRKVRHIQERNIKAFIKAKILVPDEIKTTKVYVYAGEDFRYKGWDGERFIIYNDDIKTQYLRTPFLQVKTDKKGRRYISFVITFFIYTPYELDDSSEMLPEKYFFEVAPQEEEFEKKFRKADVFIVEE